MSQNDSWKLKVAKWDPEADISKRLAKSSNTSSEVEVGK